MATKIENRGSQIIYQSTRQLDIPNLDVLSFLFDNPSNERLHRDSIIHADAADPSKSVTTSQHVRLLKRLAHTLRHTYGIREGDVVQVIFTGHYLAPAVFHAIIAAGAAVAASTPSASPPEIARQVKLTESRLLICSPDLRDLAAKGGADAGLPADKTLTIGDGPDLDLFEIATDRKIPVSQDELAWRRITSPADLASITTCFIYSSGTTGVPKAVQISHANMVAQTFLICDPARRYYAQNDKSFHYRTLAHLPAAHISGLQAYFINQTYMGGVVYWMPKFEFQQFLTHCRDLKVTLFFSVPPIFLAIAKSPLVLDHFDTVDFAMTGAAPMGQEVQAAAQKKLGKGKAILGQTWGLSETSGGFTALPRDSTPDTTGSVSKLLANCEARLVDEDGKDVQVGSSGEMWVRGPIVTKGYFKNAKANDEAFEDGWFKTGDNLFFKDDKFYYVDRKKELIKYKGFQVAPAELEALLLTHPQIADAAVIGVDGEGTELPRAYVVADEAKISSDEIAKWVSKQVASYKQLRGGVVFIPAIPKSPAGKILRKDLRVLAKRTSGAKL